MRMVGTAKLHHAIEIFIVVAMACSERGDTRKKTEWTHLHSPATAVSSQQGGKAGVLAQGKTQDDAGEWCHEHKWRGTKGRRQDWSRERVPGERSCCMGWGRTSAQQAETLLESRSPSVPTGKGYSHGYSPSRDEFDHIQTNTAEELEPTVEQHAHLAVWCKWGSFTCAYETESTNCTRIPTGDRCGHIQRSSEESIRMKAHNQLGTHQARSRSKSKRHNEGVRVNRNPPLQWSEAQYCEIQYCKMQCCEAQYRAAQRRNEPCYDVQSDEVWGIPLFYIQSQSSATAQQQPRLPRHICHSRGDVYNTNKTAEGKRTKDQAFVGIRIHQYREGNEYEFKTKNTRDNRLKLNTQQNKMKLNTQRPNGTRALP